MVPAPLDEVPALRPWFGPERPGPLIFEHVLRTGVGGCRVDRWPDPRAVLAGFAGNYALRGDPDALSPQDVAEIIGLVEAPPDWLPALRRSDPGTGLWSRVVAALPATAPVPPPHPDVHRLTTADTDRLAALPADIAWIHDSWGGVGGMLAAEVAHGAVVDGRIVSVAVPFFCGLAHEDIGVVTAGGYRRRGLSAACAGAVVADIRDRGRVPSWTTSPDNTGSLAVAARLGFTHRRNDVLYTVRTPVPV